MNKILRFTSSTCGPCKLLAKTLEHTDLGAEVEVVDTDAWPDIAESYNIRSIPTLVYLKGEKEVGRISGVKTALALEDWAHKLAV